MRIWGFVYNEAIHHYITIGGMKMSERSGKVLLGLLLLLAGALIFLDEAGIDAGDLFQVLIPGAIMVYGARKVIGSSGSKFWGAAIFLFGLLMLVGKLHLLFSSLLAVVVIYIGYRLIRRRPEPDDIPSLMERQWAKKILQEDALDRWEREQQASQR
jgi:lia operon protein LiaI